MGRKKIDVALKKERRRRYLGEYNNNPKTKERVKRWHEENKENIRQYKKEWHKEHWKSYYVNNKEKIVKKSKKYYIKNKDKIRQKHLEWCRKNPEYTKNRRNTNIQFRIKENLRSRLHMAIKNNQKSGSAIRDLGCSIDELKIHLEKLFLPSMTWTNWSRDGWHIDHILPLSYFDLTDRAQFVRACHYTNLQPMWATENLQKYNKVGINV